MKAHTSGKLKRSRSPIRLEPARLIGIYETIKSDPMKVFVSSDFGNSYRSKRYLHTLSSLGVVEAVRVLIKSGNNHLVTRYVEGYRLKAQPDKLRGERSG